MCGGGNGTDKVITKKKENYLKGTDTLTEFF